MLTSIVPTTKLAPAKLPNFPEYINGKVVDNFSSVTASVSSFLVVTERSSGFIVANLCFSLFIITMPRPSGGASIKLIVLLAEVTT